MERKVNKLEHSHVEVIVTVDEASWKDAQAKAFKKIAANVEIDGFRKGKAPENLVKQKVDQVKVMNEAIDTLLPKLYKEVIEEEKLHPIAQPQVDVTKLSDTDLEVKFLIITAPEVTLGKYSGLEIGKTTVEVKDEEVEEQVKKNLESGATLVVKEGEAKNGDVVVMDFVGSVDGKTFDGGSAQNYELELGSHSFIPGFEDQLIGHKAGDHVDVKVKFPEQYTEELKGKDALFACDIHEVKEKKVAELNDEFVKDLAIPGVETVAALREHHRASLLAEKDRNAKGEYLDKLLEAIAKDSKIDIPQEVIDSQAASHRQDFENRMKQSGLTMEQYLQILGQSEEQFLEQLKERSAKEVKNYLILEAIGVKENLNVVTDEDLEFEFAKLADQYKMKIEDVKKAIGQNLDGFRNNLMMSRIENFLFTNNN